MIFNSLEYFIFLPLVVLAYFFVKKKHSWAVLLIASYYFYAWLKPDYAILLILSTVVNYFVAIGIFNSKRILSRRLFLVTAVGYNIGVLFLFKYFNFLSESISSLTGFFGVSSDPFVVGLLLPIGISFYTFQVLGYVLDVYSKKIEPQKHFGLFASYVSFFPTILSGPIERAQNLMPQLIKRDKFSFENASEGVRMILWGLFKKIVIADRLAIVVNTVYGAPTEYTGVPLIIATIFFAFEIYADFSAYSDMAIGSAKILGFNLMQNFRRPYLAKSFTDFWRRWHISLTSWFRDYLYISLGGNRVAVPRWYFNLFIIFLVSGLWHGASITFLLWGALHGVYMVIEKASKKLFLQKTLPENKLSLLNKYFGRGFGFLKIFIVFCLTCFAWIFFKASSIGDAFYIITNLFNGLSFDMKNVWLGGIGGWAGIGIALTGILILIIFDLLEEKEILERLYLKFPFWIRIGIYACVINAILFLGSVGGKFIYFAF